MKLTGYQPPSWSLIHQFQESHIKLMTFNKHSFGGTPNFFHFCSIFSFPSLFDHSWAFTSSCDLKLIFEVEKRVLRPLLKNWVSWIIHSVSIHFLRKNGPKIKYMSLCYICWLWEALLSKNGLKPRFCFRLTMCRYSPLQNTMHSLWTVQFS